MKMADRLDAGLASIGAIGAMAQPVAHVESDRAQQVDARSADVDHRPICPDGYCRVTTASSLDEALATLPEDFTVPLLASIEKAQNSTTPAVGLMKIRTELAREWESQPDVPGPGETLDELVATCNGLVQLIGLIDELMEA